MTIVARTTRDVLAVHGPEAITWLQGQLSQDVAGLAVGEVSWSFVLAPQGKVAGWGRVLRTADDAVQIDVDPGAGAAWVARLERFKLRTKAEIELRSDVPTVAVRGARPAVAARRLAGIEGGDLIDVGDERRRRRGGRRGRARSPPSTSTPSGSGPGCLAGAPSSTTTPSPPRWASGSSTRR